MPCSPEQLAANRRNATHSTGPRTDEGKARARANSLKHGLTGEGVVIPEEDRPLVDRRSQEFEADFRPKSDPGRYLLHRAARLSVRLDRSMDQEFAMVDLNVRHAPTLFDEARRAEAERLMKALLDDPAGSVRQLRQSPEGIDALVGSFQEIRANLLGTGHRPWEGVHSQQLKRLMGRKSEMGDVSRVDALCQSIFGYFVNLKPEDGPNLSDPDRRIWARRQVADLIDQEIAGLRNLRETLDFELIAQDRDESGARAMFDPSKTAELARRYEAATERSFFRTLKEYRLVELEVAEISASDETVETSEELASSFQPPARSSAPPTRPVPPTSIGQVAHGQNDRNTAPLEAKTAMRA